MNTQTMATRFCSLVASVVATVMIGGAVTKADAGAAGGHHSHAASATQQELLEQYSKLVAALDTMATHDPATVDAAIVSGRPVLLAFLDRDRSVAPPGFSRWRVPPAALAIHLCIGQAYAFSVFNEPLTRVVGW